MTHGSLFSGIGGFDLAAENAGLTNIFQVEIDEFCQKVLQKNFPNVKRYKDINEFNGKEYAGAINIISGGFPCQPFSVAGQRKGTKDDRHLWPQMLRVIKEVKPNWVVAENVPNLLVIEQGLAFKQTIIDLENEGYDVWPLIIPAVAINTKHQRNRIWIIAHTNTFRVVSNNKIRNITNQLPSFDSLRQINKLFTIKQYEMDGNPDLLRTNDGLPSELDINRISALGNAIVPQIAYEIFKAIIQTENQEQLF